VKCRCAVDKSAVAGLVEQFRWYCEDYNSM